MLAKELNKNIFVRVGQLLAALKRLLTNLTQLKTLKLIDLMLQRYDANHLLDEVLHSCCLGLKVLHLINVTSVHCPIMHAGLFLNLKVQEIGSAKIIKSYNLNIWYFRFWLYRHKTLTMTYCNFWATRRFAICICYKIDTHRKIFA